MRKLIATLGVCLLIAACTQSQINQAVNTTVADGQFFCAKAEPGGVTAVVALETALGVPVIVTGMTSASVAAACAVIDGIPVSPPANPASAPVVTAPVPPLVPVASTAAPAASPS
jgi:hypothetical protein